MSDSNTFVLPVVGRLFKLGTNSPENILSYKQFTVQGTALDFQDHVNGWKSTHLTWGSGKGSNRHKGMITVLNYLAKVDAKSIYSILMTDKADSKRQFHPWTDKTERLRFDVSFSNGAYSLNMLNV